MLKILGVECAILIAGFDKRIEKPFCAGEANLEEDAVVSGLFLNMEPALLLTAARVRAEDRFNGERSGSSKRVGVDEKAVVRTVK